MPLNQLHHCAIRTAKLKETRDFYVDILGMEDGDRPPFNFPGHWLYVNEQPVVHLIGIDLENPHGLTDYLGEQKLEKPEGSGSIDHVAFNISMPEDMRDHMQKKQVPFQEREVPGMGLLQFFIKDPNGITVELNYWTTDQSAQNERDI